jgi:hypothetical protein
MYLYVLLEFCLICFGVIYLLVFLAPAVCLDGTLPAYYFNRGHGSGANSWVIHFQVAINLFSYALLFHYIFLPIFTFICLHVEVGRRMV